MVWYIKYFLQFFNDELVEWVSKWAFVRIGPPILDELGTTANSLILVNR